MWRRGTIQRVGALLWVYIVFVGSRSFCLMDLLLPFAPATEHRRRAGPSNGSGGPRCGSVARDAPNIIQLVWS